jgi:outer membrane protein OmpU
MNNSTRNLKMKKLLIATTALVASAGMASAEITISGSANAGYYSHLDKKDGKAKSTAATKSSATLMYVDVSNSNTIVTPGATAGKQMATGDILLAGTDGTDAAAIANTWTKAGIYSNIGVVATMTGATDDGSISWSASMDAEAGTEIDQGDFELDGAASGAFGIGSVSVTGAFGTLTFDNAGIDNLYDDDLTAADVSYATSVGGVALTIAADADNAASDKTSVSAGYTSGAMAFTVASSDSTAGTSASLSVAYTVSDAITLTGKTDQAAGKESVQTVTVATAINGITVTASSANDSTYDIDLGYTLSGVALTYGMDESDAWDATASYTLGGGATIKAGINNADSAYAGVSFAF